jgi:hypothetical protein
MIHLFLQHLYDLRLNRHVQGTRGFVGNQQRRSRGHGRRNHGPLLHPSAELMNVGRIGVFRVQKTDTAHEVSGDLLCRLGRTFLVHPNDLGNLVTDRKAGVDAGCRLLKDHPDFLPTDLPETFVSQGDEVPAFPKDLPADFTTPWKQTHHTEGDHALAAA